MDRQANEWERHLEREEAAAIAKYGDPDAGTEIRTEGDVKRWVASLPKTTDGPVGECEYCGSVVANSLKWGRGYTMTDDESGTLIYICECCNTTPPATSKPTCLECGIPMKQAKQRGHIIIRCPDCGFSEVVI